MGFSTREVVTISWYDGITECFVLGDDGHWKYASMVAWAPGRRLRVFGVVEADASTISEVRTLLAESDRSGARAETWPLIRARISEFLRTVEGEAELRLCDQLEGETKDTRRVNAQAIVDELGCEVEDASESTRFAPWMSAFSTSD